MIYLSPTITLEDMMFCPVSEARGVAVGVQPHHFENVQILAQRVAEPLHQIFGPYFQILSAYRTPEMNEVWGGHPASAHLIGQALDFRVGGWSPENVFREMRKREIPFDVFIIEKSWIHINYSLTKNRGLHPKARSEGEYLDEVISIASHDLNSIGSGHYDLSA